MLPDGSFECGPLTPTPTPGTNIEVTQTTGTGTSSSPVTLAVANPANFIPAPEVEPSDGTQIRGTAQANATVSVVDPDTGIILCSTTASTTGSYSCTPSPTPANGEVINVVSEINGNTSNPSSITINTVDTDGDGINNVDEAM